MVDDASPNVHNDRSWVAKTDVWYVLCSQYQDQDYQVGDCSGQIDTRNQEQNNRTRLSHAPIISPRHGDCWSLCSRATSWSIATRQFGFHHIHQLPPDYLRVSTNLHTVIAIAHCVDDQLTAFTYQLLRLSIGLCNIINAIVKLLELARFTRAVATKRPD